jgi:hypothetical protein
VLGKTAASEWIMARNIKGLAKLLGAKVVGKLPDTGSGPFGAARQSRTVQSLQKRVEPGGSRGPGEPTHSDKYERSVAGIFARLWDAPENRMSPKVARYVLKLGFPEGDRARMHELAVKNQAGKFSAEEREELFSYVTVGNILALLQSKARRRLKQRPRTATGHKNAGESGRRRTGRAGLPR